jgi:hypothetical protein
VGVGPWSGYDGLGSTVHLAGGRTLDIVQTITLEAP